MFLISFPISLLAVGKGVNLKKKKVYGNWYGCTVSTEMHNFAFGVGPFVPPPPPTFPPHSSNKTSTCIELPSEQRHTTRADKFGALK